MSLRTNIATILFSTDHAVLQHHHTVVGAQHGLHGRSVYVIAPYIPRTEIVVSDPVQRLRGKADDAGTLLRGPPHDLGEPLGATARQAVERRNAEHIHAPGSGHDLLGRIPFGIAQIGKSFRNEITPGNFIFRVREFEQMELEFFCKPGTDLEWFNYWRTFCHNWLLSIGLKDENLRLRDHDPEELCFYSKATTDFEFLFPFGWGELWGVADRTDYDLTQHQNTSGVKMVYREGEGKDMVEYVPYVIEPSLGVERSVLAVLCDAYDEEVVGQDKKGNDDVRVVLHFHPALAPFKAAILPLSKKDVLAGPAMELYNELSKEFMVDYDETGSIGKRYRREDEIGTPYCITFDFDTVGDEANGIAADHCVTIRERDSMEQVRIPIDQVKDFLREKCAF